MIDVKFDRVFIRFEHDEEFTVHFSHIAERIEPGSIVVFDLIFGKNQILASLDCISELILILADV